MAEDAHGSAQQPEGNTGSDGNEPTQQPDSGAGPEATPENATLRRRWAALWDRNNWATLVVLPLAGAFALWAIQSVSGWLAAQANPPGLTAYALNPRPCVPAVLPITLETKTDKAVLVTGIDVTVVSSKAPPHSKKKKKPPTYGCNTVHDPAFDVNLAQHPVPVIPRGKKPTPDRTDFPFTISPDQPKQLTLNVDPAKRDVLFKVKVEWVAGGEYGSVTLGAGDTRNPEGIRVSG
ncbi:hypothetical protein AB0I94_41530 [Streptomyces sp. NPDC050147]|uniref:hypothetical protein n=1 Tax=Streptomyces sp. NPDC050147 TaxID=3155513 RepID=UPI003419524D